MTRVAVVGNLSRDVVDAGPATPGGCPSFAAEAFRALGVEGQIVTRFADEDRELFQPLLGGTGIQLTLLPAESTTGFAMEYDGDARTMSVTALGEEWRPGDVDALEPDVGWVHVAPLLRGDFSPMVLQALAAGRRLSLDGQGLVRNRRVGPLARDPDYDPAVLSFVTALKLSEEEARVAVGGAPLDAERAATLAPEVLLTLGSRGAIVFASGEETPVSARPVPGVHTTGAGDTFMVGYAAARSEGRDPVEAAELACELVTEILEERRGAT